MNNPGQSKRQHWYRIHIWFCVLCGKTEETRERIYGRRPKDDAERYTYQEDACGCHFA